ncbi:MAG: rhomboid family intramembrane serine protease [candidate division WOR-3 bacterium]|nr:MAG: rhomboid family intramembrane serine protease [candidate division WOR-3 bacterium]
MIPLRDDIRADRRPFVTYVLVASCTLAFLYQLAAQFSSVEAGNAIILNLGMIPRQIARGQRLWTLVTSMFLHGGFFHIIGNMLYLWIFGDNVEDAFGRIGYVGMYLASGLFGSALHILIDPSSGIPTIGASGAISGVMGAYFVLYPRARVLTLVPIFFFIRFIHLPAFVLLGFWILLQMLYGCSSVGGGAGVAYFAHIGGFVVGVLLGLLVKRRRRQRPVWYDIE